MLEADLSDRLMFVHREDYFRRNGRDDGDAEIIVAKQRNGPPGIAHVRWLAEHVRFEDRAPELDEDF